MLTLFDEGERSRTGPFPYAEPTFQWLNESATPRVARLRATVEKWFDRFPEEEKSDLRARFRSKDNRQHGGAAFELLLHEVLVSLGCEVVVHPATETDSSGVPDFLAVPPDSDGFYVEATLVTGKSDEERMAEKRKRRVYDLLDDLESPNFFLGVNMSGSPTSDPSTRALRRFLERKLGELDPDAVAEAYEDGGPVALPTWECELEGWELEFFPIPKSPEARGETARTLGFRNPGISRLDDVTPIRDKLQDKAYGYGKPERPFVIAVNALAPFVEFRDVNEALYGSIETVVPMLPSGGAGEPRTQRAGGGLWWHGGEPGATHVSAVLAALELRPWNPREAKVRVFDNPWADRPLGDTLSRLPRTVFEDEGRFEVEDGETFGEVLGLPEGWPAAGE